MERRAQALLFLCLLLFLAFGEPVIAQPRYWIALNFRLTFNADGTVRVDEKLHPFTVDGRSLLNDPEVAQDMNRSLSQMVNYALLMFSDNPRLLTYRVVKYMEKSYGETVLCDVTGTGRMERFTGAYIVSIVIWLNTSNYVRSLNDSLYEVKVRDSFTSTDPRSWIDVLEVVFNGTRLYGYRWEPPYAHGPERLGGGLLWVNHNEQEAPDFYVFQLEIPGLRKVGEPPEVKAVIEDAVILADGLHVTVKNVGSTSGYVYIRVLSQPEQARKVYLFVGEKLDVVFPSVRNAPVEVELYSGDSMLDRARATRLEIAQPPLWSPRLLLVVAIPIFIAAILAVFLARRASREAREKQTVRGEGLSGVA